MARKQQKRHNRGSDRRKTAHAHRSTRHMQPVRTQKTVRRRLPEAEVRRRQRARRRQFALLGLAVLLIVLIFAFRHLISTPQQSGADGDTGNSGTSATEEVKQVAKAVNVYQSVMYYQPVVQKYAEQNGIPEYTDVLLAIMQVEGSAGLPNDSLEEESSIRQGCTYFAHLLSKGKSLDCDLDCIIQAYNYGSGFLDYAAKFNGVYSTELAEKFAEKQSGGNTIQYDNPMAVQENGGWRYAYGNMFYARLVKQYLIE